MVSTQALRERKRYRQHALTHRHLGSDEVAVAVAIANGIPKAAASALLDVLWLGTGAAGAATVLRGDQTWGAVPLGALPLHASTHKNGGTDEVATLTPAVGAIPKAGAASMLTADWLGTGAATANSILRGNNTWGPLPAAALINHAVTHEPGGTDPMAVDAVAATGSLRTLGTGAQQAAAGNHTTTLTGDVTGSGTSSFAATIAANAVTDTKLRDSAALSVIGRSANSSGDPADIPAGTDGYALRRISNVLDFFPVGVTGRQVLTSGTGATYTPTSGTRMILVELWGGGGGGGGGAQIAANAAPAGGGASGGYAAKFYSTIAASYLYSIGALGAGGLAGNNNGTAGGDTTFNNAGTVITAKGGTGGTGSAAGTGVAIVAGGATIVSSNGDVNGGGQPGGNGLRLSGTVAASGPGGTSAVGGGGAPATTERQGIAGTGKASGGGGGLCLGSTQRAGGAGTDGLIVVTEFA